ncbi:MAG: hypothetical protein LBK67_09515 [Coriobacteriales bacterium]|jgi:hypothetical protein|nr:hypothetical protein [Coriobacteriales bacterium]
MGTSKVAAQTLCLTVVGNPLKNRFTLITRGEFDTGPPPRRKPPRRKPTLITCGEFDTGWIRKYNLERWPYIGKNASFVGKAYWYFLPIARLMLGSVS